MKAAVEKITYFADVIAHSPFSTPLPLAFEHLILQALKTKWQTA
jgi:hypothetical protein